MSTRKKNVRATATVAEPERVRWSVVLVWDETQYRVGKSVSLSVGSVAKQSTNMYCTYDRRGSPPFSALDTFLGWTLDPARVSQDVRVRWYVYKSAQRSGLAIRPQARIQWMTDSGPRPSLV
jgi:hypothetical protein